MNVHPERQQVPPRDATDERTTGASSGASTSDGSTARPVARRDGDGAAGEQAPPARAATGGPEGRSMTQERDDSPEGTTAPEGRPVPPATELWRRRAARFEDEGLERLEHGDYEAAARYLIRALTLYEEHEEEERILSAAQYLGVALYEQGKTDQAVKVWEEMMSRGWSGPTIFGLLLRHYEDQGRSEDIERLYRHLRHAVIEGRTKQFESSPPQRQERPQPPELDRSRPGPLDEETSGPRILVADNDPDVRAIIVRLLSADGYDVVEAGDGEKALEMVLEDPPELVVLDVYMPKLSGLDLLYQMRARGMQTAAIVVSGLADASMVRDSVVLGAQFLGKPLNVHELRRSVKAQLAAAPTADH